MQLFSLIFIVQYSGIFEITEFWRELSLSFASLSALVFAVNFFEGRFVPKIGSFRDLVINTFLLNVVILSALYHYILFEYFPYTIIYAILFVSIIFNLKAGIKPTIVYVIGWSVFCFLLFVFDFKDFYIQKGFVDLVLIAFAIEAVLFTISVSYRYSNLSDEKREYENMLFQQSKLAKSGEMIGNITHQFRQPLNNLSYILINIKNRFYKKNLSEEYFERKISQANEQIEFLSKTINDFKEFYTPSKKREVFLVKGAIENVESIFSAELKKYNIKLNSSFGTNENIKIYGIKNELSQVLLAIFSNSIDVLKNIENPRIEISVNSTSAEVEIVIYNNGPQIKSSDLEKLFNPYFTTKENGSGLGLFLSKKIMEESFQGRIEVKNCKEGCSFSLFIEKAVS